MKKIVENTEEKGIFWSTFRKLYRYFFNLEKFLGYSYMKLR
jgi:hypothetical protein